MGRRVRRSALQRHILLFVVVVAGAIVLLAAHAHIDLAAPPPPRDVAATAEEPQRDAPATAGTPAARAPRPPPPLARSGCVASVGDVPATWEAERHHLVAPPAGPVALVCCATTRGPLSVAVHPRWAPRGAARFVEMVRAGHFDDGVPMMRCLKNFLCQFGLSSNATRNRWKSIPDDPPWLPHGPKYREDAEKRQRYKLGYFGYAGAGKNTRGEQLIVANHDDCCLGGGSPWETPFGELVGEASYETLAAIHTGYGDNGPDQGTLKRAGWTPAFAERFPLLDHITKCAVVDDATQPADWAPYPDGFLHPTFRGAASLPGFVIAGAPP